jgi:hypothetical protein
MLVRTGTRHADQGFVFDEIKRVGVHLLKTHSQGLRRAAAGAGLYGSWIFSVATIAGPNQLDVT